MADTKKSSSAKRTSQRKTKTAAEKAREQKKLEELRKEKRVHDEIWAVVIIAFGIFLIFSLMTSMTGALGAAVESVLFGCFGKICSYIAAVLLIVYGIMIFAGKASSISPSSLISMALMFVFISCLFTPLSRIPEKLSFPAVAELYASGASGGGVVGTLLAMLIVKLTGRIGFYIFCSVAIIAALMFIINNPISDFFGKMREKRETARLLKTEEKEYAEALASEKLEEKRAAESSRKRQFDANDINKDEIPAASSMMVSDNWGKAGASASNTVFSKPKPEPKLDISPVRDFTKKPAEPEKREEDELPENKKQILSYMSDSTLFGKESPAKGYGLDGELREESIPEKDELKEDRPEPAPEKSPTEREYKFPPVTLLKKPAAAKNSSNASSESQARILNDTLQSFKVNANVVDIIKGPAVTRFEVQPAAGVKVSSIVNLQDDIALNLRAKSIRIEAPIPGKAAVGIEVANDSISTVALREIIESSAFTEAKSKITVCLGKSISGDSIVANLKSMPHLLIAGATGSGKSVCINSIIISLLYKAKPDEVKLILIDPKVVELSNYNGIPHLWFPVVTEPAKASAALNWAVVEMNSRYNRFSEQGVRDLQSYNEAVIAEGEKEKVMPQVVIIIDELADLIMAAQNAVEDSICRLAQKARAAGMHLIVATQRPSVDVITGVIKANIPSRIAFAVSSQVDSRTILDTGGAEKLLGKGDMLYFPQGISKPLRVQGSFVSDSEVNDVIAFVKKNAEAPEYSSEIQAVLDKAESEGAKNSGSDPDSDELLFDAAETVVRAEQASVSMLQRRFRIGYNRAARLIDMMEERGIVGPPDGSRPRKVNISTEELDNLRNKLQGSGAEKDIL